MTRTLIAGFGNVLRGDDGFGVAVLRRLAERGLASESVELLDVGTGGIRLAQEPWRRARFSVHFGRRWRAQNA